MSDQIEEQVESHNLSMYPQHWDAIDFVAREHGFKSRSMALRWLIDEWRKFRENDLEHNRTQLIATD